MDGKMLVGVGDFSELVSLCLNEFKLMPKIMHDQITTSQISAFKLPIKVYYYFMYTRIDKNNTYLSAYIIYQRLEQPVCQETSVLIHKHLPTPIYTDQQTKEGDNHYYVDVSNYVNVKCKPYDI